MNKTVVVPSAIDIQQPQTAFTRLPVVDASGTPVHPLLYSQTTTNTVSPPSIVSNTNFRFDPYFDYVRMYSTSSNNQVHEYQVSQELLLFKFWNIRAIIDWIEACASDYVLMQMRGATCHLAFVSIKDRDLFRYWEAGLEGHVVHSFELRADQIKSMRDWLAHRDHTLDEHRSWNSKPTTVRVRVRRPDDEIHFKLRWTGVSHTDPADETAVEEDVPF